MAQYLDTQGLNTLWTKIKSTFALKADLANLYKIKGSCAVADLPTTGNTAGDVWNLTDESTYGPAGTNVVWVADSSLTAGGYWDALGGAYTHPSYTSHTTGFYKVQVDTLGHVNSVTAVAKSDITALGIPGSDTTYTFDGTYDASSNKAATVKSITDRIGALDVSAISGSSTKTITSISETDGKISATYSDIATMTGASSSAAGSKGFVPAPAKGDQLKFLRADGTWVVPTNTTYTAGTGLSLSGTAFSITNAVTAGTAGTTSAQTPSYGSTFNIPYVTYDANGLITGSGTSTVKIPASDNTDQKVKQNASTTDGAIPLLLAYQASPTSGTANYANYATGITANPSTGTITATTFSGSLSGKATSAGTADTANSVAWGNITSKPSTYTPTIGTSSTTAAAGNHTHTASLATSTGTSAITLSHGTKYVLTAGGSSVIFTTPSDNDTTYTFAGGTNGFTVTPSGGTAQTISVTPSITNNALTTSSVSGTVSAGTSSTAGVSGTVGAPTVTINQSTVTTALGYTPAKSNHTHTLSIAAAASGTSSSISLAASTAYTLTAGGKTYTFTTGPNTTYSNFTAASASAAGKSGLVPAPAATYQNRILAGDATWKDISNWITSIADDTINALS